MESPYEIPNLENQKNDVGTCQKPMFCEENNFDDPVHLCNFAAKFANYDETASVFETPLQFTVL